MAAAHRIPISTFEPGLASIEKATRQAGKEEAADMLADLASMLRESSQQP
jgi:hypothetical protein